MGICKNSDKLLAKSLGKALKGCDTDFIGLDTLNSFSSSMCGFIPGVGQHEVTQLRNVSPETAGVSFSDFLNFRSARI